MNKTVLSGEVKSVIARGLESRTLTGGRRRLSCLWDCGFLPIVVSRV